MHVAGIIAMVLDTQGLNQQLRHAQNNIPELSTVGVTPYGRQQPD